MLQQGGRGTEVGALRAVEFGGGKRLLERLVALDDRRRVCTYTGLNYGVTSAAGGAHVAPAALAPYPLDASPFPGAFVDYVSTVRVEPAGAGRAVVHWDGEVWTQSAKAADMRAFLTAFYSGNIETLVKKFAA